MEFSMRDPATASSRIYIGNLGENVLKSDIENIFRKYGNIRGIMLSRNFGFVQYESEESAKNAIANEHENKYFNRKLIVKNAMKGNTDKNNSGGPGGNQNRGNMGNNAGANLSNPVPNNNNNSSTSSNNTNNNMNIGNQQAHDRMGRAQWRNNQNNRNNEMNASNNRERSPLAGRNMNNMDRWNSGPGQGNFGSNHHAGTMGGMSGGGGVGGGRLSTGPTNMNNNMNSGVSNIGSRNPIPMNDNVGDDNRGIIGGGNLANSRSAHSIRAKHPDANDCEIIVLAKPLTEYAEMVESRLKRLGLLVDLLFPNADVPIGKVLANIASKGCLYAIVVNLQHLEMRSITVNILYGNPAEHRNMPVDDAIELIYKNFQQLMRGGSGDNAIDNDDSQSQYSNVPPSNIRHPEAVQHLINLLAENRSLTGLQYDCVIKYLQERREIQYKTELGDTSGDILPVTAPQTSSQQPATPPPDPEIEVQKRLRNILNKPPITNINNDSSILKSIKNESSYGNAPRPSGNDAQDSQLLNDPVVQKALDSLLLNQSFF